MKTTFINFITEQTSMIFCDSMITGSNNDGQNSDRIVNGIHNNLDIDH